jgi:hypothetical protein
MVLGVAWIAQLTRTVVLVCLISLGVSRNSSILTLLDASRKPPR